MPPQVERANRETRADPLFRGSSLELTPYGLETTGYEVYNLADTLKKATSAGAQILVAPYQTKDRQAAMVQFPGGYIAEIHSKAKK